MKPSADNLPTPPLAAPPPQPWRKTVLAGCVVVPMLALLVACGGPSAEESLKEAESALNDGNFSRAAEQAGRAEKSAFFRTDALVLGGIAKTLAGERSDAVNLLQQAWQGSPEHFYAAYFYGWSLESMQQYADALAPLEKAVELRPDHTAARILLSRCCLKQNLPSGIEHLHALADSPQFAEAKKRALLYNDSAYLLVMAERTQDALAAFNQALQLDPENPRFLQNKAILYDRYLNQPSSARRFYIRAIAAYQKRNEDGQQAAILRRLRQLASLR